MIMPRKGGIEAFQSIKRIRPDIKALFISGYSSDKFTIDEMQHSGSELIFKPVSSSTLLAKVREILDR
jgi:YesN/AraC family two-component response regulator